MLLKSGRGEPRYRTLPPQFDNRILTSFFLLSDNCAYIETILSKVSGSLSAEGRINFQSVGSELFPKMPYNDRALEGAPSSFARVSALLR